MFLQHCKRKNRPSESSARVGQGKCVWCAIQCVRQMDQSAGVVAPSRGQQNVVERNVVSSLRIHQHSLVLNSYSVFGGTVC